MFKSMASFSCVMPFFRRSSFSLTKSPLTLLYQFGIYEGYHRLTRADTVLPGANTPIHPQSPWKCGKHSRRAFCRLDAFALRKNSEGLSGEQKSPLARKRTKVGCRPPRTMTQTRGDFCRWKACLPLSSDGIVIFAAKINKTHGIEIYPMILWAIFHVSSSRIVQGDRKPVCLLKGNLGLI